MAKKITELTQEDIELVLSKSAKSLPLNPTKSGIGGPQIRATQWQPILMLLRMLQKLQNEVSNRIDDAPVFATSLPSSAENISAGDTIFVANNGSLTLYVYNGTSFLKVGYSTSEISNKIDSLLKDSSDKTASIEDIYSKLDAERERAISAENKIQAELNTEKEERVSEYERYDKLAKNYSDKAEANSNLYTDDKVSKILDGASTVAKSLKDGSGNTITSTYETKSDAKAKVAVSNLRAILGLASASAQGLMSPEDKSRLDALYALLGDTDDADDVVNTINEVLAVFAEYPEGANLANALSLKVAFSDVINNLQSNEISKPLSAYQGKVLDGRLAEVEGRYVDKDDVFAAGMISVTGYDQSTGKITLRYNTSAVSINYTASTGVIKFTY